jgi:cell division protein FtsQ
VSAQAARAVRRDGDAWLSLAGLGQVAVGAFMGMALIMLLLIGARLGDRVHAPIISLQVQGELRHVGIDELREVIKPFADTQFFRLDLKSVRAEVVAMPWVESARVSRAWPGVLRLQIIEHVPVARLEDGRLLSANGSLFEVEKSVAEAQSGLPLLAVSAAYTGAAWNAYQAMSAQLQHTPLEPVRLSRDLRGDWRIHTRDDIELRLGRDNPIKQVERLKRAVLPGLAGEFEQVAYIDLRYGNGFAVGWREGASPEGH